MPPPPSLSSLRLGLGAQQLFSARTTGARRIAPPSVSRACLLQRASPFSTSQPRPGQGGIRRALEQNSPRVAAQQSPKLEMAARMNNLSELATDSISVILPGTFVIPTFSQFPKPFSQKLSFFGQWLLIKGQEVLTNAGLRFSSKPTIFKAALFKPNRSLLVPTAKALHRSMAEALAAGDKTTLSKICSRKLANTFLASIDARPRGRRYGWELVAYTNKLFYPSIRSHRMSPVSRERHAPIIRQVVVAISSKQRRFQYDAQGGVVPGSEKVIDVVENVAIACVIDGKTWKQGEWLLVGTVKPTTFEEWQVEKELLKTMLHES